MPRFGRRGRIPGNLGESPAKPFLSAGTRAGAVPTIIIAAGLALVVMLAVGAAFVGYRGAWSIHEHAQEVIRDHLVQSGRGTELELQIERESLELVDGLVWILGACALLALACAGFTVWTIHRSFRRLEWKSQELQRVSWHMLESHERIARRFSHEMHDELGQTLTGLKGLLKRIPPGELEANRGQCIAVVDEALTNVRELSQLLRPVVLDDFGLDAGLRWLGERFQQRTGISVEYEARLPGRLSDSIETQIFRIAQEALTNVARHSDATTVRVSVREEGGEIQLVIEDNGRGLSAPSGRSSLGMVGMRARARQIGGELVVRSAAGSGVRIEVAAPAVLASESPDEEDQDSLG
ncbi:MAG: sensor histidine kinase [Bryobacterales bacterium]|nr:sensor histidine kinase [Bryobacterales bacterium]